MYKQILIVEDEQWASDSLSEQLQELLGGSIVLHFSRTVRDAVNYLSKNTVDLVFMDIHLGDGISFDIFNEIKADFPVIFTTAYDQYALQAFQNQGYAYLLKPFDADDLKKALEKVSFLFTKGTELQSYKSKSRFLVKYGNRMRSVPVEEVAYFMADDKILFAYTFQGDQFIVDETIASLMPKLLPENFFQINRKFIVHITAITEMVKTTRGRVKLKLNPPMLSTEVIVSEDRSLAFQHWLNA